MEDMEGEGEEGTLRAAWRFRSGLRGGGLVRCSEEGKRGTHFPLAISSSREV